MIKDVSSKFPSKIWKCDEWTVRIKFLGESYNFLFSKRMRFQRLFKYLFSRI